jgi:hypothetical protein
MVLSVRILLSANFSLVFGESLSLEWTIVLTVIHSVGPLVGVLPDLQRVPVIPDVVCRIFFCFDRVGRSFPVLWSIDPYQTLL